MVNVTIYSIHGLFFYDFPGGFPCRKPSLAAWPPPSPEMESQRGAAPAEWAFVPGDDLLLLLGEGGGFCGFFGWRNCDFTREKG